MQVFALQSLPLTARTLLYRFHPQKYTTRLVLGIKEQNIVIVRFQRFYGIFKVTFLNCVLQTMFISTHNTKYLAYFVLYSARQEKLCQFCWNRNLQCKNYGVRTQSGTTIYPKNQRVEFRQEKFRYIYLTHLLYHDFILSKSHQDRASYFCQ